jgi:hypothetical protein
VGTPAAALGRPELADLFRTYGDRLGPLGLHERRVAKALATCRTAALGGHVRECDRCGRREISYNSCRDRHCPKCQGLDEARWVEARERDLLPVPYFHVVFTVPEDLRPLFLAHRRPAYDRLFAAVAETLQEAALNPRHLGARVGFTAVLHTWTQTLLFHPHVHCVVPGGGLHPEEDRWVAARPSFLLPVRVLSRLFRGKLLSGLSRAVAREGLRGPGGEDFSGPLARAARQEWVVYAKPPFAGPEQVLAYLGRYTCRVALSNDRLVAARDGQVTFRWRDRARGNRRRTMTLDVEEFLRRFLLHVLPPGFVRIRHYGLLANPVRVERLARCRRLLGVQEPPSPEGPPEEERWEETLLRLTGNDVTRCAACREGRMHVVETLPHAPPPAAGVIPRGASP